MAQTPTTPIALGYEAPHFSLPDTISDKIIEKNDVVGTNGLVTMFICNHCPFVVHVIDQLINLANDYLPKGIGFVAISSNDVENYPADSPQKMKEIGLKLRFPFPYLYDETQEIAKAYTAACTPDFSVFDNNNLCVYRGQLDDSRPGNNLPVTGKDLRYVLDCLISNKPIPQHQKPSIGCNIKWKSF